MNRARQSSARPGLQPGKENNDNQIQKSSDVQGYIIRCTRTHMQRGKKKKSSPSAYTLPFASGRRRGYGLIINHAVEMDWVLRSCQMRAADGRMVK